MKPIASFFAALLVASAAPLFASCLDVAEGRARRDLDIGRASQGAVRVDVAEGLAAVRRLGPRELHLWASAPTLSFRLTTGAAEGGAWDVRIENLLPDAELVAATKAGAPLPVEIVAAPFPTERTFRLELPANEEITLSLAAPDRALLDPWRFAVFADVQEAIGDVQDIYSKMNTTPGIRFALISGDLTAQGTPEQLETFQREMKTLVFPCYATLGNHELGTRDDLYHEYFGRGNYTFDFRGVRFTMIDSASATLDPLVYTWLDGWLEGSRDRLHVVTMHIVPIDPVGSRNGSFASRAEADKLLAQLARGGVDLTFYGHIHSYYAFENAGIPAHITGGGGAIPERMDGIGRHFLTVDVLPPGRIEQVAIVRVD
ncbi:metallophosphoesterase family protein [Polyangium sorediatum]|uniref:Metallophosphoesterase n=1 Tax=Polyangium sorediatum TaxID=889274 RepID=A0ABT6NQ20_9BACT|nr:metallophosphoesterase [Polyangium sorediatum]MDI1430366.1 metallophosphoesterase [Polyangium sorediatum]